VVDHFGHTIRHVVAEAVGVNGPLRSRERMLCIVIGSGVVVADVVVV
jgi:hypothetical protein